MLCAPCWGVGVLVPLERTSAQDPPQMNLPDESWEGRASLQRMSWSYGSYGPPFAPKTIVCKVCNSLPEFLDLLSFFLPWIVLVTSKGFAVVVGPSQEVRQRSLLSSWGLSTAYIV